MPGLNQPPLPPFEQIARHIAEQIARGELGPGDRIASERQIMDEWGVSKATANKAVAALKAAGLVASVVGVGTTVVEKPPLAGVGPRDMFGRMQRERRIRLPNERSEIVYTARLGGHLVPAQVVQSLGMTADSFVLCRRRVIYRDEQRFCVAVSWFSSALLVQFGHEVVDRLVDPAPIPEGTPVFIARMLDRDVSGCTEWVEALAAQKPVADELGVEPGAPVLRVVSTLYSGEWPLECGEYFYPAAVGVSYSYDLT